MAAEKNCMMKMMVGLAMGITAEVCNRCEAEESVGMLSEDGVLRVSPSILGRACPPIIY